MFTVFGLCSSTSVVVTSCTAMRAVRRRWIDFAVLFASLRALEENVHRRASMLDVTYYGVRLVDERSENSIPVNP
jgi:mevalonate kinase